MGLLDGKHLITVNSLFPKWLFGIKKNEVKASTFESYYSTYFGFVNSGYAFFPFLFRKGRFQAVARRPCIA